MDDISYIFSFQDCCLSSFSCDQSVKVKTESLNVLLKVMLVTRHPNWVGIWIQKIASQGKYTRHAKIVLGLVKCFSKFEFMKHAIVISLIYQLLLFFQ